MCKILANGAFLCWEQNSVVQGILKCLCLFLWVSQSFCFFLLETPYMWQRCGEGSRASCRCSFNEKLKVAPQPVRLFCRYAQYDKLSKTLQHAVNAAGFLLSWSLWALYTLWKDDSDLEQKRFGQESKLWAWEWGKREGMRKKGRHGKWDTLWESW